MRPGSALESGAGANRALALKPVLVAWLLTVAVDLFFNAGVFSGLFTQSREPNLLPDDVLFRRIPIAYFALAVGVTALAWLLDRTGWRGAAPGALIGALAGGVLSLMGIVTLWTAVDMTGLFVAGGVVVQMAEFGSAGAALGAFRSRPRAPHLSGWLLAIALVLVVVAVIAQNLLVGS